MWYAQKLLSSPPISYLKLHNSSPRVCKVGTDVG